MHRNRRQLKRGTIARKLIKLSKTSQLIEKVKSAQSKIREEIALPKKTNL